MDASLAVVALPIFRCCQRAITPGETIAYGEAGSGESSMSKMFLGPHSLLDPSSRVLMFGQFSSNRIVEEVPWRLCAAMLIVAHLDTVVVAPLFIAPLGGFQVRLRAVVDQRPVQERPTV